MQNHHKSVLIRLFDNPMDRVIQEWLDDVPNRQNGGKSLIIKTALFEYAQEMGYQLPEPEPIPKKVIKVISARRRAEREALEAKKEAEEKAEMDSFIQEKTGITLPDEDDDDFLKKMAQSMEDNFL